jgi:hypothetical protein
MMGTTLSALVRSRAFASRVPVAAGEAGAQDEYLEAVSAIFRSMRHAPGKRIHVGGANCARAGFVVAIRTRHS